MKLESQVCSLELSKKLKALGVRQESYFVWAEDATIFSTGGIGLRMNHHDGSEVCAAFSVAELLGMMPICFQVWRGACGGEQYICRTKRNGSKSRKALDYFVAPTAADATAKMLCYLLENKIISIEDVNARLEAA